MEKYMPGKKIGFSEDALDYTVVQISPNLINMIMRHLESKGVDFGSIDFRQVTKEINMEHVVVVRTNDNSVCWYIEKREETANY